MVIQSGHKHCGDKKSFCGDKQAEDFEETWEFLKQRRKMAGRQKR